MVFSSTIFLFLFLPLVLTSYLLVPARLRNLHLLLASLFFYAWGETWVVLALVGSILVNHALGLWLQRTGSRGVLAVGVTLNLALFLVFKYLDFVVDNLNVVLGLVGAGALPLPHIKLPIGISFFTFQVVSYLIDVYRKSVRAQRNVITFGLYVALFPQLIAGPIVRYSQIAAELVKRRVTWDGVRDGVARFIVGLAKKMLVANTVAELVDEIFALDASLLGAPLAWLGIAAYTVQIYFDFSGYSDMAIGLGRILGFTIPENFNYPYVARSIREIWSRWHISMTTWFRDYVYIPMGGNRGNRLRTYFNLVSVFVLCGLWHGAAWNFVIFGLYQGLFLILERQGFGSGFAARVPRLLKHVYAMAIWMLGLAIFRTETMADAGKYMAAMLGANGTTSQVALLVRNDHLLMLAVGVVASLPWIPWLRGALGLGRGMRGLGEGWRGVGLHLAATVVLLTLFGLSAIQLAGGTHNPFIYFRF